VIYDLHHRYLFIHFPRTAGVAITRALAGVSSHCVVDLTAGRRNNESDGGVFNARKCPA